MAQTIINFTDTAFLGRLGVIALGASMLAGIFYLVFTTVAAGFAVGIQIIVARRFGEKNYGRIGIIFEHGAIFVLLLGLALFSILYLFSDQLLLSLIKSPSIYKDAVEYIAKKYNIATERAPFAAKETTAKVENLYRVTREAARYYFDNLRNNRGKQGAEYFNSREAHHLLTKNA